jgi:hypothetical protein
MGPRVVPRRDAASDEMPLEKNAGLIMGVR